MKLKKQIGVIIEKNNIRLYKLEDEQKQCSHSWVYKILHDHTAKNVCEKCHLVVDQ